MKNKTTYLRVFTSESEAFSMATTLNQPFAGWRYAVVDHPGGEFAVMDIRTVIEFGFAYRVGK